MQKHAANFTTNASSDSRPSHYHNMALSREYCEMCLEFSGRLWQQASLVVGLFDVNVDGVQRFSYSWWGWRFVGGEPGRSTRSWTWLEDCEAQPVAGEPVAVCAFGPGDPLVHSPCASHALHVSSPGPPDPNSHASIFSGDRRFSPLSVPVLLMGSTSTTSCVHPRRLWPLFGKDDTTGVIAS